MPNVQVDLEQLRRRCLMQESEFEGVNIGTEFRPLLFIDRKASVLAVAHLDSVIKERRFAPMFFGEEGSAVRFVFNGQLDDRLGAYIVLDLLPLLGVKCDVLLTTDEERGMSTASLFQTEKKYNWMFSFDRRGDDVVMYQYRDKQTEDLLTNCGFKTGYGSFSDICELWDLECRGFNFGCGYQHEHTQRHYADLDVTEVQVARFVKFWKKYRDTHFPYSGGKQQRGGVYRVGSGQHAWNPYATQYDPLTGSWYGRMQTQTGHSAYSPTYNVRLQCNGCGKFRSKSVMIFFGGKAYCIDCIEADIPLNNAEKEGCAECGDTRIVFRDSWGAGFCRECYLLMKQCQYCGDLFMPILENQTKCEDCMEIYETCSYCDEERDLSELHEFGNDFICDTCLRLLGLRASDLE